MRTIEADGTVVAHYAPPNPRPVTYTIFGKSGHRARHWSLTPAALARPVGGDTGKR